MLLVEVPVRAEFQSSQPSAFRPGVERTADSPHVQIGITRREGKPRIAEAEADEAVVGEVAAVSADGVGGTAEAIRVATAEQVLDRGPGFVLAAEEILQLRTKRPGVDFVSAKKPPVAEAIAAFVDPLGLIAKLLRQFTRLSEAGVERVVVEALERPELCFAVAVALP